MSDDRNVAATGALKAAAASAGGIKIEELSDDQIQAARKRRMEERCVCCKVDVECRCDCPAVGGLSYSSSSKSLCRESWRVNIDEIQLPDNHPFAVKMPVRSHC